MQTGGQTNKISSVSVSFMHFIHITFPAFVSGYQVTRQVISTMKQSRHKRVYPKVSGLAAWSYNCKWYSSLPLGAVVLLNAIL
jgi:hypothetical protein